MDVMTEEPLASQHTAEFIPYSSRLFVHATIWQEMKKLTPYDVSALRLLDLLGQLPQRSSKWKERRQELLKGLSPNAKPIGRAILSEDLDDFPEDIKETASHFRKAE